MGTWAGCHRVLVSVSVYFLLKQKSPREEHSDVLVLVLPCESQYLHACVDVWTLIPVCESAHPCFQSWCVRFSISGGTCTNICADLEALVSMRFLRDALTKGVRTWV